MIAARASPERAPRLPLAAKGRLEPLARWSLAAALLTALAIRVWLNARSNWLIDGDEALFGIAAVNILHGAHPTFLYGVPYMGMLQSYAAVPVVALLGPTPPALRLVTILGGLAYVVVTWLLAHELYDPSIAALAAWFAAIPSVYFDATGLKVWGVYVGVMALGGMVLVGVWRCRRQAGRLHAGWWLLLGLAAGLVLWANFLVVYYLATALLLLPWRRLRAWLPGAALGGIPGLVVGGSPLWWYNLRHHWATFHFVFGGTQTSDRSSTIAVAEELWRTLLPRVLGLTSPWSTLPRWVTWSLGAVVALALLNALIETIGGAIPRRGIKVAPAGRPWPLLLFLVITLAIYLLSGFGRPSLSPFDASGRYLLPLWTAAPILVAALCARVGRIALPLGAALVLLVLAANLAGHLASSPRLVFQSPYWNHLPLDSRPLYRWLLQRQVTAVWMNHWAGNQLMYATGGQVLAADYYDIVVGHGINRLPDVFERVRATQRVAYVVVTAPGEITPLEQRLRQLGVAYEHVDLPPYQVFLPTSRHVDPSEVVNALAYPY